ncbi:MAG TPA: hypothetical protein VGB18_07295 [Candidatus Thermoplasmatota archaeon]
MNPALAHRVLDLPSVTFAAMHETMAGRDGAFHARPALHLSTLFHFLPTYSRP